VNNSPETATFRGVEVPVTDPETKPHGLIDDLKPRSCRTCREEDAGLPFGALDEIDRAKLAGPINARTGKPFEEPDGTWAMSYTGQRMIRDDGALEWAMGFVEGTFQATFARIFQETFDLLVERQRKYGPENISSQGIYGVFTRMSADKIERLRRSMNGRVVEGRIELDEFVDSADETVEDALLDIANYALIMLALKRGVWGKPLQEPA